jgi:transposase
VKIVTDCYLGANFTPKEIDFALNRDIKCIKKWIDRYERTGIMNKMPNKGCQKLTISDQEFAILCAAIENTFCKFIFKKSLDTYVSVNTISRRLRENKYYACVA